MIRTQFNRHSNWLQCNAIGGQQHIVQELVCTVVGVSHGRAEVELDSVYIYALGRLEEPTPLVQRCMTG